jgi:hypothetical protein
MRRIIAVLAGMPGDPTYAEDTKQAAAAFSAATEKAGFSSQENNHRRGTTFPATACGISCGQGQKRPCRLANSGREQIFQELLQNPAVQRAAAFGSGAHVYLVFCTLT